MQKHETRSRRQSLKAVDHFKNAIGNIRTCYDHNEHTSSQGKSSYTVEDETTAYPSTTTATEEAHTSIKSDVCMQRSHSLPDVSEFRFDTDNHGSSQSGKLQKSRPSKSSKKIRYPENHVKEQNNDAMEYYSDSECSSSTENSNEKIRKINDQIMKDILIEKVRNSGYGNVAPFIQIEPPGATAKPRALRAFSKVVGPRQPKLVTIDIKTLEVLFRNARTNSGI